MTKPSGNYAYAIVAERRWYDRPKSLHLVSGETQQPLLFGSRAEARAHADRLDMTVYHSSYGECGRPIYRVTRVGTKLYEEANANLLV